MHLETIHNHTGRLAAHSRLQYYSYSFVIFLSVSIVFTYARLYITGCYSELESFDLEGHYVANVPSSSKTKIGCE